jgi:hypothetical protein
MTDARPEDILIPVLALAARGPVTPASLEGPVRRLTAPREDRRPEAPVREGRRDLAALIRASCGDLAMSGLLGVLPGGGYGITEQGRRSLSMALSRMDAGLLERCPGFLELAPPDARARIADSARERQGFTGTGDRYREDSAERDSRPYAAPPAGRSRTEAPGGVQPSRTRKESARAGGRRKRFPLWKEEASITSGDPRIAEDARRAEADLRARAVAKKLETGRAARKRALKDMAEREKALRLEEEADRVAELDREHYALLERMLLIEELAESPDGRGGAGGSSGEGVQVRGESRLRDGTGRDGGK